MVDEIQPLDLLEADHRDDVLVWIDSGVEIFRTAKPATPPKHLVSYCILVDSEAHQVLLVDHRDAGLWLPTGGHVDLAEHPGDAARREIQEELGIRPAFHAATGDLPVTVTQTAGVSTSHTDVSLWFAFEGSTTEVLSPDPGEFVAARWWGFGEVVHGPGSRLDPHLPRFVDKLVSISGSGFER